MWSCLSTASHSSNPPQNEIQICWYYREDCHDPSRPVPPHCPLYSPTHTVRCSPWGTTSHMRLSKQSYFLPPCFCHIVPLDYISCGVRLKNPSFENAWPPSPDYSEAFLCAPRLLRRLSHSFLSLHLYGYDDLFVVLSPHLVSTPPSPHCLEEEKDWHLSCCMALVSVWCLTICVNCIPELTSMIMSSLMNSPEDLVSLFIESTCV